ncbi:MAG: SCO family protein [Burkholderiaceae bacterium]|nr:SCO family protein [Burkholderiaceae bacterium]
MHLIKPVSLWLTGFFFSLLVVSSCFAQSTQQSRAESARLMNELMSGKGDIGGPFSLTDQNGKLRSLSEFNGKITLIYFGYMFCPDVCPTDLANLSQLLKRLGPLSNKVQVIFITLDPVRDTQELMRNYVNHFDKRILGLRGTETQTKEIATKYKTFYEKVKTKGNQYLIDHTAFIYIMDQKGNIMHFSHQGHLQIVWRL